MIRNFTPHTVIVMVDGKPVAFPCEGVVARVASKLVNCRAIDGIPFGTTQFGNVVDLPEQQPGVYLIVSALVIAALPDRLDLVRPDTGPDAIRENGNIVAVRRLTR